MIVNDVIKYLEGWAPKEISWQKDNPGLQIGQINNNLKNIFLCLELTKDALDEAVEKKCNLIFTHHPFIFQPLKKLDFANDKNSQLIQTVIKNDITLYSAHTNLDFTKNGVSFKLAKKLQLKNISFLENQENNQFKLIVFVPKENLNEVADSIFNAGGGIIGEYSKCSFQISGKGTFEGSENSNPKIGKAQNFEQVEEIRLEVLVNSWNLKKVISEMIKSHPYEQPAFDVYPLQNKNVNFGFGAIGELENHLSENDFLNFVQQKLNLQNLRFTKGKSNSIKKVAVCGGSGSELLKSAISQKADAFVTADVKYHTFHDAQNEILLVDAGHYETEILILDEVKERLEKLISVKNYDSKIYKYSGTTNPINFLKII